MTHPVNSLAVVAFLILWLVLVRCAHLLLTLVRHRRLIGWAIGPLGLTLLTLHEPSLFYIWLNVLIPALVSGIVVYIGLFTTLSPFTLPHVPLLQVMCVLAGMLITGTGDVIAAFWNTRYPLWGEVRILRTIHLLRGTWTRIHLTPFGIAYLSNQFGFQATDLLKVF
jgi:hypothetical protein